ncbi:MAG: hypothetical protein HYV97_10695 [Bdellovibrio sp.]|nr:hypothetical protein [Bdellovibrio sp.]
MQTNKNQGNYDATQILLGESQAAFNYLDRLLFTVFEMAGLGEQVEFKSRTQQMILQLVDFWEKGVLHHPLRQNAGSDNHTILQRYLKAGHGLLNSFAAFDPTEEEFLHLGCDYINLLYAHAHGIHNYLKQASAHDVPFPNLGALYIKIEGPVPCFATSPEQLRDCAGGGDFLVLSLEKQRDKKYAEYVARGHKSILHQNYALALQHFTKALKIKNCAEALTLAGWAHGFLGQYEQARNFCLKAIASDPDYGPPYNDLGTYLFKEGKIDESLQWFTLAKRAPIYDNREFPYINTARVYLARGEYEMAVAEFTKAQMLAPFNSEITATLDKIRGLVEKNKNQIHSVNTIFEGPELCP